MFLNHTTDFAPKEFLQVTFRGRRCCINLAVLENFIKPDSHPGRCVSFTDGIGGTCHRDRVVPDRLHKGFNFISKGLTQDILTKANRIVLILAEGIIFAKPLVKRNAKPL